MNGILFDLDGTLWDSSQCVVESWNYVLKKYGRKQITLDDMHNYMGRTMEVIANMMLPDETPEDRKKIFDECCDTEIEFIKKRGGILFENLEETLKKLSNDYKLFIVSNCQVGYIESFIEHYKFEKYFTDIESYGNTGLEKGDNIRLVVDRNNLDKSLYVGDIQGDLDSADKAGIPFIHAAYGFGTTNRIVPKIDDITKLPEVVKEVFDKMGD